uniref:RH1 domain-containing protein n=2 Tax=Schistocephalus solidus TaxID=70667 RepID=A0A0X3PQ13_SCHSO
MTIRRVDRFLRLKGICFCYFDSRGLINLVHLTFAGQMFTTTDVYSAASAIGQELQLLIDEFGPDDVESFMFKVITVLEDLEACVNLSTEMEEKVNTLREKLESLRSDRQQFSDSRDNYAMNLEQLQQSWYRDTSSLFDEAAALEAENERLKQKLEGMRTRPGVGTGKEDQEDDEGRAHETKSKISALVKAISRGSADKQSSMAAATALSDAGVKKHVDEIVNMTEQRLGLSKQEDRAADLQLIRLLKAVISEQSSEMRHLRLNLLQHEASIDAVSLKS